MVVLSIGFHIFILGGERIVLKRGIERSRETKRDNENCTHVYHMERSKQALISRAEVGEFAEPRKSLCRELI